MNHAKSIESALRDQSAIEQGKPPGSLRHVLISISTIIVKAVEEIKSVAIPILESLNAESAKTLNCHWVGQSSHRGIERERECPARGKTCEKCGVPNLPSVCFRDNNDKSNKLNINQINLVAHLRYSPDIKKYTTSSPNEEQMNADLHSSTPPLFKWGISLPENGLEGGSTILVLRGPKGGIKNKGEG